MFYLKVLFEVFKEKYILVSSFLLMSVLLITFSFLRKNIEKRVTLNPVKYYKSMVVLVENNKSLLQFENTLSRIDGVSSVKIIDNKLIESKKSNLNKIDIKTLPEKISNISFSGMKVLMKENITKNSINNLKNYITNVLGEENVTFSALKKVKMVSSKIFLGFFTFFNTVDNLTFFIYFILITFWLITFYYLTREIKQKCYLYEQFQRKDGLAFKMTLSTNLILIFLLLIFNLSFFKIDYLSISSCLIIIASLLVFKNKWNWNQQW